MRWLKLMKLTDYCKRILFTSNVMAWLKSVSLGVERMAVKNVKSIVTYLAKFYIRHLQLIW
jgi:hypothetical protein